MNDTEARTFAKGDEVTVDATYFPGIPHGTVFTIEKVPVGAKGVNYTAKPKEGSLIDRGVKGPAYCFKAYDANAPVVEEVKYLPIPPNSSLVTVTGVAKIDPTDLYVVLGLASKSITAVRLQKIGGDGGRYWKSIPVSALTVIDPARITVNPA